MQNKFSNTATPFLHRNFKDAGKVALAASCKLRGSHLLAFLSKSKRIHSRVHSNAFIRKCYLEPTTWSQSFQRNSLDLKKYVLKKTFLKENGKQFFPSYSLDDVEKNMQNISPDYSGCLPQIVAGDNSLDPTQATEPRATFTLQMELAAA